MNQINMLSTPKAKSELFLASSLYDGLEDNNIQQVTTLLLSKEADPNVLIPSQGITPFHLVIGNDSEVFAEEVTKLFLRHGGNPNVKSVDGMSPVHVAAAWGRLGVLELLLANGGDPLLVDDDGRCPFHYAFDGAHYDAVAMLGKYCGEAFEDDSAPKYKIGLDKVLVTNGGIVAEYGVSDDTFVTASDVPVIRANNICYNNNRLLEDFNEKREHFKKPDNYVSDWYTKCYNADATCTTTTDESSLPVEKFVTVRRGQRCLPTRITNKMKREVENEHRFRFKEQDYATEKELVSQIIERLSVSHTNNVTIDDSFFVQPQKEGEHMPRISSPKNRYAPTKSEVKPSKDAQYAKCSKTTPKSLKKPAVKTKFVHKTPLRTCPKKEPISAKKTPMSANSHDHRSKVTPVRQFSFGDKKTTAITPRRFVSKENRYSPDCSIVSKSPNLIITPKSETKYNNDNKVVTPSYRRESPLVQKKTPVRTNKTPKSENVGRHFSRFVKQSDLRTQLPKSPKRSPLTYRNDATPSSKITRTPNLTDSTKQKRMVTSKKILTTPTYYPIRSPRTPMNKTYNKTKQTPNALSPGAGLDDHKFRDRKTLRKNVAIKLEETLYDDDAQKMPVPSTFLRKINSKKADASIALPRRAGFDKKNTDNVFDSSDLSNILDNRSNHRKPRTTHVALEEKYDVISGIDLLPNSTKATATSTTNYDDSYGSKILAGVLRPDGRSLIEAKEVRRPQSSILAGQFHRIEDNSKATSTSSGTSGYGTPGCNRAIAPHLKKINSQEIDESLISTDHDSDSTENQSGFVTSRDSYSKLDLAEMQQPPDNKSSYDNVIENDLYGQHKTEHKFGPSEPEPQRVCTRSSNFSSSAANSAYESFVSIEEEYKYEDAEAGVILLERRLLVTPVSIPLVKSENEALNQSSNESCSHNDSVASVASSLPQSLVFMDSETLRRELTKLDHPPGPITATTRQIYLKRLRKLQKSSANGVPCTVAQTPRTPVQFCGELEKTLQCETWMNDLTAYKALEQQVLSEFANPDPTRRWREGTTKSSFNYLLMDPRVTDNLPRRADTLSTSELWRIFLSSIFYVGKGKRSRPYAHLYEAGLEWNKSQRSPHDKKINHIIDIWKDDCGVVCLHIFQNAIPVEAYTREASMIETLGLDRLKNVKPGDYYGVASTWSRRQKRMLGVYLLYKAMHIFLNEGERQLRPGNIE